MTIKKYLILLALSSLTLAGCGGKKTAEKPAASAKPAPINEPVNVIDLKERPFVQLSPRADGREIKVTLNDLKKDATSLEYELEYQAGTTLQGAFGSIDLTKDKPPTSKEVLLGSCSAGGKCTYNEGVTGGSITLKFRGPQNYVLKDEWRFQDAKKAKGEFSSQDAKFQVKAGKTLDASGFVITMQTSGLPKAIDGTVLSGPYGIFVSKEPAANSKLQISMRLSEDTKTAKIYGWQENNWVAFDTKVADKTATATVPLLPVYIAVSQ
jgi:hypothetical protein